MKTAELAERLGCLFEGPDCDLTGAASLGSATGSQLSFVASDKLFDAARASGAGCVVAPLAYRGAPSQSVLRSDSPRALFARALTLLYPEPRSRPGVHPSAQVAGDAIVADSAEIGALCTIDGGSVVGPHSRLAPGCHIGRDVRVGAHCLMHPGVIIYSGARIGDHVTLHSGCVLGADGFGFAQQDGAWVKFPQVGHVEIEDHVEIGANSCVDRAALGRTRIGAGTKLDNMVHVGHNCDIGRNVVIAAQTGLSGGVTIGDGAIIGGQVGIGDKARIEAGVVLGSGSGVLTSKIVHAGQPLWGTPARPLREYLEQLALAARLPEMRAELKALRARLAAFEDAE